MKPATPQTEQSPSTQLRKVVFGGSLALILFATTNLYAANRDIHPNWVPKIWKLRPDDITTIMGYRAELTGNLTHADLSRSQAIKDASIRGFKNENDMMTWEVEAPYEAEYTIALLYGRSEEILSTCSLEVTSGTNTIREKLHPFLWENKPIFSATLFQEDASSEAWQE